MQTLMGIPLWLWGAGSLMPALLYTFAYPKNLVQAEKGPLNRFTLRWSHALAWYCIAGACFIAMLSGALGIAQALIGLALAFYIMFMLSFLQASARYKSSA